MRQPEKPTEPHFRDDAKDQPESGYPEGRVNTKPSAERAEDQEAVKKGSEAEFDSEKSVLHD